MLLKDIFEKPVDRSIEGVVKADDEASLLLEVEEYVVTNEIAKRLESFIDAYNNYEGANGVWISGFFGSGKSHLLKILAMLMEDRSIDGKSVLDLFRAKCGDNEILWADLKRAVSIPSKSILFNIDQKADVISKTQIDALLSVFVKVFDEMCGYYGKLGHVAKFERQLDGRGLYGTFKQAYEEVVGKDWESGREEAILESANIAKAYAKATGAAADEAVGILDKFRSEYKVSIEDFAEQVNEYIETQDPDFRLNFFVDEVGQYIAENTKLMTNLQTVAESLATKCRGRAWVVVTAQQDFDKIIGEMTAQQGNDFSKIQDRFRIRMKLTSANVAEVIQKRLLQKNEQAVTSLSDIYHEQSNNFKTMFDFADGAQTYINYKDRDHFIHCYPFIPYQFDLFQTAIQSLSQHDAFEGQHSSVGERSMLGVFQQVVKSISDRKPRELPTFDLMFEGIRTALKANIHAIHLAEKNLDNPFAVRVLKTLFLIKYVKSFKSTVRNLCVLMLDNFDRDIPELKGEIQAALDLLDQQTYIQRNGEVYEFLTNTEKDVEQEIKNIEVEASDVSDELAKLVFDYTLKKPKIRFDENGQDYPFARKLDDRLAGREQELTIHVISPFNDLVGNQTTLAMHSSGRDELLVIMPENDRLVRDLLLYKKTDKYYRQNISVTQQESIRQVLTNKSMQNQDRYRNLQFLMQKLLGQAKLIINLKELEISGSDPQTRITQGFFDLLRRTYPNLNMLRGIKYTESEITKYLKQPPSLLDDDARALSEAEQDVLAFIQSNNRNGIRTTMKDLVGNFEKKPYGWYLAAILCTLAKLSAREKLEFRVDSNPVEGNELTKALRNTHGYGNVIISPQIDFTVGQIRKLKTFYEDFFDGPPKSSEAKPLAKETADSFQDRLHKLETLTAQRANYPFLAVLDEPIRQLKELIGNKEYAFYLTDIGALQDNLLDMKEDVLEPLLQFMGGSQKTIYDEARTFIREQEANLSYLDGEDYQQLISIIDDSDCFKGNRMQQVKELVDRLRQKISVLIDQERDDAKAEIRSLEESFSKMADFQGLKPDQQEDLLGQFGAVVRTIEKQAIIAVIKDSLQVFRKDKYSQLLSRATSLAAAKQYGDSEPDDKPGKPASEPKVEYVSGTSIKVSFAKRVLENEADLDDYLQTLKEAYLKEIRAKKRIQI